VMAGRLAFHGGWRCLTRPRPATVGARKKPLRFGTGGADLKFDQNPRGAREAKTTTAAEEIRPEEELIVVARKFISGQQEGPRSASCQAGSPAPRLIRRLVGGTDARGHLLESSNVQVSK
jgi:hypothetical protein